MADERATHYWKHEALTACGRLVYGLLATRRWGKVTCKNCLKKRPENDVSRQEVHKFLGLRSPVACRTKVHTVRSHYRWRYVTCRKCLKHRPEKKR